MQFEIRSAKFFEFSCFFIYYFNEYVSTGLNKKFLEDEEDSELIGGQQEGNFNAINKISSVSARVPQFGFNKIVTNSSNNWFTPIFFKIVPLALPERRNVV